MCYIPLENNLKTNLIDHEKPFQLHLITFQVVLRIRSIIPRPQNNFSPNLIFLQLFFPLIFFAVTVKFSDIFFFLFFLTSPSMIGKRMRKERRCPFQPRREKKIKKSIKKKSRKTRPARENQNGEEDHPVKFSLSILPHFPPD